MTMTISPLALTYGFYFWLSGSCGLLKEGGNGLGFRNLNLSCGNQGSPREFKTWGSSPGFFPNSYLYKECNYDILPRYLIYATKMLVFVNLLHP